MHTETQPNGERENNLGLESTASQPAPVTEPSSSTNPPIHQSINPTPASPEPRSTARRRQGKVARLPRAIRQRVNEMLDDGLTYPQVIASLGTDGQDLTPRAVMSWKGGGYQDYLRQQRLAEQCRRSQDRAFDLIRQNHPINAFQATQQLAAAQICEVAAESGAAVLRDALQANPLNYFRMLNSFSRLTTGGLKCEKHLLEEAGHKARLDREANPTEGGLSPEVTRELIEKLNLM